MVKSIVVFCAYLSGFILSIIWKMPEQDLNPSATKFISSLVRSLQILCNGQVEFNQTIELVGHINVKIDHKYKFDYIVDEHVSKEGEDSSTTFLSNSYHSCRPAKLSNKKPEPSELEKDVIFSEIPKKREKPEKNLHRIVEKTDSDILPRESNTQNYSVSVEPLDRQFNEPNQMVVKLEGGDDSNDCMVLPASPGEYEGEENRTESYPVPGPSSSFDDSLGNQTVHTRKRRKFNTSNQGADDTERKVNTKLPHSKAAQNETYKEILCSHCNEIFLCEDDLKQHQDSWCPYYHIPFLTTDIDVKTCLSFQSLSCTLCQDVFKTNSDRAQHMSLKHGVTLYLCDICSEFFGSKRLLWQHKKIIHDVTSGQQSCPICGKKFTRVFNLRGHMNMHKGTRPYKCSKCGQAFAYSQSQHRHQKFCNK